MHISTPPRDRRLSARPVLSICPATPKPKATPSPAELVPRTPTTPSPKGTTPSSSASEGSRCALRPPATGVDPGPVAPPPWMQPPSPRRLFAAAQRCATFVEVGPEGSRGDLVYANFSYLEVGEGATPRYWVHVWDVRTTDNAPFHVEAGRRTEFAACVMSNYLLSAGYRTAEESETPVELGGASYASLAPERLR